MSKSFRPSIPISTTIVATRSTEIGPLGGGVPPVGGTGLLVGGGGAFDPTDGVLVGTFDGCEEGSRSVGCRLAVCVVDGAVDNADGCEEGSRPVGCALEVGLTTDGLVDGAVEGLVDGAIDGAMDGALDG